MLDLPIILRNVQWLLRHNTAPRGLIIKLYNVFPIKTKQVMYAHEKRKPFPWIHKKRDQDENILRPRKIDETDGSVIVFELT